MSIGNFFWELAKITILNPRMWVDMAIVLGPPLVAMLIFVWYKSRQPETKDEVSESTKNP